MINATGTCPTAGAMHAPWCDAKSHARFEKDVEGTDEDAYCVGRIVEAGGLGGWLFQEPHRETVFNLDQGPQSVELNGDALRTLLQVTSPDNVNDFRGLLTAALAEIESE